MQNVSAAVLLQWTKEMPTTARIEPRGAKVTFEQGTVRECDVSLAKNLSGHYKGFMIVEEADLSKGELEDLNEWREQREEEKKAWKEELDRKRQTRLDMMSERAGAKKEKERKVYERKELEGMGFNQVKDIFENEFDGEPRSVKREDREDYMEEMIEKILEVQGEAEEEKPKKEKKSKKDKAVKEEKTEEAEVANEEESGAAQAEPDEQA